MLLTASSLELVCPFFVSHIDNSMATFVITGVSVNEACKIFSDPAETCTLSYNTHTYSGLTTVVLIKQEGDAVRISLKNSDK